MKNKFLVSMLAAVIFVNFTIPGYVIDAAAQGSKQSFSRNVAPRGSLKKEEPQRIPEDFFDKKGLIAFPESAEFTDINANLINLNGNLAWGDYNNDGFLDLIITGNLHQTSTFFIKLYKNNGDGTFISLENTGLAPVSGCVKWADFNNDGYLDLVLSGFVSNEIPYYTRIYRNNQGDGTFLEMSANLIQLTTSNVSFVDYNSDGNIDFLISGYYYIDPPNSYLYGTTKLYRNDGNFSFTEITTSIPAFAKANHSWGDFDNDGKKDLFVSGYTEGIGQSKIFHNDGQGTGQDAWNFSEIQTQDLSGNTLPLILGKQFLLADFNNDGQIDFLFRTDHNQYKNDIYLNSGTGNIPNSWKFLKLNSELSVPNTTGGGMTMGLETATAGDYDNDGYLDLAMTLFIDDGPPYHLDQAITKIYHNDGPVGSGGQIQFTDINADIAGAVGDIEWGDYNGDGSLDIALTGTSNGCGFNGMLRIYRNNLSLNVATSNTAPNAPENLQTSYSENAVILYWDKATDAQTSQNGLSYNIYMGTTSEGVDKVSPNSNLTDGWRKVVQMGHQRGCPQSNTANYTVNGLVCETTYYWGVQAIDTVFAGSEFAVGAPFTTGTCPGGITYTLTVNNGSGSGSYLEGDLANISANDPTPGMMFSEWTGDVSYVTNINDPDTTVTMPAENVTVTATYASIPSYTISGYVRLADGSGVENVEIRLGAETSEEIIVLAQTNEQGFYSFAKPQGWVGHVHPYFEGYFFDPQARAYYLLSDQTNEDYLAIPDAYTLTYTAGPGGSISGPNPQTVNYGEDGEEVTAVADTGYSFVRWSDDETQNPRTDTNVTSNIDVTAEFALQQFTITYYATTGGSVSLQSETVAYGQNSTPVLATANSGYEFFYWKSLDGEIFEDPTNPLQITNVTKNYDVVAFFWPLLSISGAITHQGQGLADVAVTLNIAGEDSQTTQTNPDGTYTFSDITIWSNVSVTAQKEGYQFDPQSYSHPYINENKVWDFTANPNTLIISGMVYSMPNDMAVGGVKIKDSIGDVLAVTDNNGLYSISVPFGWTDTLTPEKAGYKFNPVSREYVDITQNQTDQNYEATVNTLVISGRVYSMPNDMAVGGVEIKDSIGDVLAVTDDNGLYNISVPYGWSDTLTPEKAGYKFNPVSREYVDITQNQTDQNYEATVNTLVISGMVYSMPNDMAVHDVMIKDSQGQILATTDTNGIYALTVNSGFSGTLIPEKPGYRFNPQRYDYDEINQNQINKDYIAFVDSPKKGSDIDTEKNIK